MGERHKLDVGLTVGLGLLCQTRVTAPRRRDDQKDIHPHTPPHLLLIYTPSNPAGAPASRELCAGGGTWRIRPNWTPPVRQHEQVLATRYDDSGSGCVAERPDLTP